MDMRLNLFSMFKIAFPSTVYCTAVSELIPLNYHQYAD